MLKIFKNLFGNKYDRDVKKYLPIVDQINEKFSSFENLSIDELRGKTIEFRSRIAEHLKGIDDDVLKLKKDAEIAIDFAQKELIYNKIDELSKERDQQTEVILNQILPEAFAVVKETARRFKENESFKVKATDHDRELSIKSSYVTIEGDEAIWQTKWLAAGNEIKWDMLHYDVQLIGGMVLHDGKIAEMTTGEGKTLVATLPAYLNACRKRCAYCHRQ